MSALRRLLAALVLAAASALPLRAQDSVVVAVAGDLAGRTGDIVQVPITADMSAAPGRALGGYRLTLTFDPALVQYYGVTASDFGAPVVNSDSLAQGRLKVTALLPAGATGLIELMRVQLYVLSDTAPSAITLQLHDLTATSASTTPFEDLMPLARVVSGTFCRSLGRWGDLNHDGRANSLDALMTLSHVVGLSLPDTNATPALADVDDDGAVTSLDALIILSYAVGLPVTGKRVLLVAAGACGTAATTLVIRPDTVEVQVGQYAAVIAQATDRLGRAVPAGNLTWLSSDPSIAAVNSFGGEVEGRGPGTATLTAQLGPGVQAQLTVIVVPRRRVWYVDVRRARGTLTQTGAPRAPFEFIGDAAGEAGEGDTLLIAAGTYEELVSEYRSLVLLGDSLDRPVIDPRAYPYWNGGHALNLGSGGGRVELAHLIVRGGSIYIESRDQWVHNVLVDSPNDNDGLAIYNQFGCCDGGDLRAGAPAAAPDAAAIIGGGRALIENVEIRRAPQRGIYIEYGDTVTVRNNLVTGDSATSSCYIAGYASGGIMVDGGSAVHVHDNVVSGAECVGVGAFARRGWARVERNRVSLVGVAGLAAAGRDVRFLGNHIRDVGHDTSAYYYQMYGIYVNNDGGPQDTLRSLSDTIVNVQGYEARGLWADSAVSAAVDQIRIDSIGLNGIAWAGYGVEVGSDWFTMTNARIRNVRSNAFYSYAQRHAIGLRDNEYRGTGGDAVAIYSSCECSGGIDSVVIVGDTADVVGGTGFYINETDVVRLDSLAVDSAAAAGITVNNITDAGITRSTVTRSGYGVYASGSHTVRASRLTLTGDTTGFYNYAYNTADTTWISGVTMTGGSLGVWAYEGVLMLDSSVVTGHSTAALASDFGIARITRSRLQNNLNGVIIGPASDTVSLAHNNISGHTAPALLNQTPIVVDADSNYWGAAAGPACAGAATGCNPVTAGDTVSGLVSIAPWDSVVNSVTPAPRPLTLAAAVRVPAERARQLHAQRPQLEARRAPAASTRPSPVAPPRPTPVRAFPAPWQKGRPLHEPPRR